MLFALTIICLAHTFTTRNQLYALQSSLVFEQQNNEAIDANIQNYEPHFHEIQDLVNKNKNKKRFIEEQYSTRIFRNHVILREGKIVRDEADEPKPKTITVKPTLKQTEPPLPAHLAINDPLLNDFSTRKPILANPAKALTEKTTIELSVTEKPAHLSLDDPIDDIIVKPPHLSIKTPLNPCTCPAGPKGDRGVIGLTGLPVNIKSNSNKPL